jgi:predicted RNase H-like HicB family nuclease
MDYPVVLKRRADGDWLASAESLPGCTVRVRSRDEALEQIRGAIQMYIQSLLEEAIDDADNTAAETVEQVTVQV